MVAPFPARPKPAFPPPSSGDASARAGDLLAWYDRHRRVLPWRAKPGETADPYRVWLSEIMLQQTRVEAVRPYYEKFLRLFPTVEALASAPSEAVMTAWAGLGYYSRARNLHACAKAIVAEHGGRFPGTEEALRGLPGIGAYTAGAIAAIAFDRPAAAVDGNVERVMSRLHTIDIPMPAGKAAVREATLALVPMDRPGDFAQALMDLGATICTPKRPACALCPWMEPCRARQAGAQETYPRKGAKAAVPTRRGIAFVALRADNAILLRTRPGKGLLGGMAEVPGGAWLPEAEAPGPSPADAPLAASWRKLPEGVRHVFTHFALELTLYGAALPAGTTAPQSMRWTKLDALETEPLPNLMRKVIAAGVAGLKAR